MLLPIFLVRLFSQEAVGDYKIFFLYLSLAPAFALSAGLLSNVPFWSGRREDSDATLRASFQLVLATAFIGTLLALLLTPSLQHAFDWTSTEASLFALAVFGTVSHQFIEDCLIARGKIWISAVFGGSFEIVRSLALIFAAWYWHSTAALFACYTLIITVKVLVAIFLGLQSNLFSFAIDWGKVAIVARRALPISLAALFAVFIDRADQFVLSNFLTVNDFATYSLGCLVLPPLLALEISIMRVCIPRIATALAEDKRESAARAHSYAIEQLALLLIPASAGLVVFAEPIIVLLFTEQYRSAAGYLQLFAFSYLLMVLPFDACARALGDSRWLFRSFILFSTLCLCSAVIGAWAWGAFGALAAALISKLLMRLYGIRYAHRTLQRSYRELLPIPGLVTELILVLALSLFCLLIKPLFASTLTWFVLGGSAFAIIYLPVALFLRNQAALSRSRQPRILQLVQNLRIGGLEKIVTSLAKEFATNPDVHMQILVYEHPSNSDKDFELLCEHARSKGVRVDTLQKRNGFSFFTVLSIIQICLLDEINIVHSHNIGPLVYGGLARIFSLGAFKLVHTNHSFSELDQFPKYARYERMFTRVCSKVVAVSADIAKSYGLLDVPIEKLKVIPNGVSSVADDFDESVSRSLARERLIEQRQELKPLQHKSWLLCLARLHPLKGQDQVIELWNALDSEVRSQSCLLFVGPSIDPDFSAQVIEHSKRAKDCERIFFCGASAETHLWLRASDALLSLSRLEGLPLTPLEAILDRLPVVLSDIEAHRFLSEHALLVNPTDAVSAANQVAGLFSQRHSSISEENLRKSAAWAAEHFSLASMARAYSDIYLALLR